jgi:hypothetical protein
MDTHGNSADDELLARLRTDYRGHRIWRSVRHDGRLGGWVATLHDPAAGLHPTLVYDDAGELREALDAERRIVMRWAEDQ